MKINILAIGTKMPAWVETGCDEYRKRLPRDFVSLKELPLARRSKSTSLANVIESETQTLLSAVPTSNRVLALDKSGQSWSTEKLANNIGQWQLQGQSIAMLIGGPDGLTRECVKQADMVWSLSALTLPHPIVRIVLYEQLYRAWSYLNNHPYHK